VSTSEHIAESEEPTAAASTPTPPEDVDAAQTAAPDAPETMQAADDTVVKAQEPASDADSKDAAAAPPGEAEAGPEEKDQKGQVRQKAEASGVVEGPLVPGLASDFLKLVHLSTRYPEIGPPVAELAFKTGYSDLGQRIIKVGLESDAPGLEHYTVAAKHAKHMRQYDEAMRYCADAVRTMAASPERYADADDGAKLLHLVRLGFTILMFELKDTGAHPHFISTLQEELPRLSARMETDPFYHTLRAQVLWYTDKEASEQAWDRAAELGDAEFAYNARGTWYKEAEHDPDKAEGAYRKGLEQAPGSSLLQHNLAQVLLEKARRQPETARKLLQEARALVKSALLGDCPRGLRRHIYNTRAELDALQDSLRQAQAQGKGEKQPRRERVRPEGEKREGGEKQEE
jgi:tetratricopeptide (TPR) repeat protein